MKSFQTQCPHCQHTFMITESQLAIKNGLARCGNCRNIFSAIDNLSSPSQQHTNRPTAVPTVDRRKEEYTFIPNDEKLSLETNNQDISNNTQEKQKSITQPKPVKLDMEIIDNFDNPSLVNQTSVSANIKNSKKNIDNDHSWIEKLLEEEKDNEKHAYIEDNKLTPIHAETNSVSSLLEKFGVASTTEPSLKQDEYIEKISQRFNQQQPTSQQAVERKALGMQLVWLLGSILLVFSLFIQYIVFNIDNLIKNPDTAEKLINTCQTLKLPCNLPSTDLTVIHIKTISVNAKGNQSDVIFTLSNQSDIRQLYPNLRIRLLNNTNTIAQTVISPNEYLDVSNQQLMPKQIKPVKIRLDYQRNKFDQVAIESFY